MRPTFLHIIFLLCLQLACFYSGQAQSGFYVPASAKIFFNGDTATIFSNVTNQGKIGIGRNAVINFKGKTWENDAQAMLPDESDAGEGLTGIGGYVRFNMDTSVQYLIGGYNAVTKTGASFPGLVVDNPFGLQLLNSTAKVRHRLQFNSGHLLLNNQVLVVGHGNPGQIEGFHSGRFIVTGSDPGGGMLVRENITQADGKVIFPVGTSRTEYTPAAVQSRTAIGDDYYVSVFDSVKSQVFNGANLRDSSVNKTWEIGKRYRPNQDMADVFLQHLIRDEGSYFSTHRNNSYIAAYVNGKWDTTGPRMQPVFGNLTAGNTLFNSAVNSRPLTGLVGSPTYFAKFASPQKTVLPATKIWFNGYRVSRDSVRVYWTTKPEINNDYFIVQRRLSNETDFSKVDSVDSKALNGISVDFLQYEIMDPNNHKGLSYYRLMLVSRNRDTTYTNIVVIPPQPGGLQLTLWPNPSKGRFYIGINGEVVVRSIIIWDVLGRKVKEELVNGRTIIEMHLYMPGSYYVTFMSNDQQRLDTKKLIIQPW
ncbi:MAG: T9SS type A sorting domain-containing protein [Candidatus Pseudobacter hemicellulosilyticus]|uniref:T9SS type A sorting domain-containing protein n=1 Tax=Candidatus Pseudobacter hemicellulosilyticus TaxID=3121375 RepID=A0AAJ5WU81_9BACT|nr:MAG: T9SS type A sorting domain-containing protein [Pseudobacter sp.]